MDLYHELYKVKDAEVDALRHRIKQLEQENDKVTKWLIRIHGSKILSEISPGTKICQTTCLEK